MPRPTAAEDGAEDGPQLGLLGGCARPHLGEEPPALRGDGSAKDAERTARQQAQQHAVLQGIADFMDGGDLPAFEHALPALDFHGE